MIVNEQHRHLHFAAQEVCLALAGAEVNGLNVRARIALVQLALVAGCTHVAWWPNWARAATSQGAEVKP